MWTRGAARFVFFDGGESGRGVFDVLVQATDAKGKVIGIHESTGMEDGNAIRELPGNLLRGERRVACHHQHARVHGY